MGIGNSQKGGAPNAQRDVSVGDLLFLSLFYFAVLAAFTVWESKIKPLKSRKAEKSRIEIEKNQADPIETAPLPKDTLKNYKFEVPPQVIHYAQNFQEKNTGQSRLSNAHLPIGGAFPTRIQQTQITKNQLHHARNNLQVRRA